MKPSSIACAIYTRKSSEEGLEQGFNSLDAQREACNAYVLSQKMLGWRALQALYDDGGFSGGNTHRPALQRLLADITASEVRIVVVYKVDRLTRSLADFAKMVELFDANGVSFVSVTQQFNTTSSMGRLTLNVLLSFAQFEREVTGERIRDKIAASKRKGLWMGGVPPIGYQPSGRSLAIVEPQAAQVREIYRLYLELGCVSRLKAILDERGWTTPERRSRRLNETGGRPFSRGHLYRILGNPIYAGKIVHKGQPFDGEHPAIVTPDIWQAVQERMAANRQGDRGTQNHAQRSLLAGLVFDDVGEKMIASHASKGPVRYRYYVGRRLVEGQRRDAPAALRVPAQELEDAVIGAVMGFFQDEARVLGSVEPLDGEATRRSLMRSKDLSSSLSDRSSQQAAIGNIVERVVVSKERISIQIKLSALGADLDEQHRFADVEVPARMTRCGQAVRLIINAPSHNKRTPDPKLVSLLGRAQDWFERLTCCGADDISSLAAEVGYSPSYVTRVMYLAFLAPDIVKRLLQGDYPPELGTHRLMRSVPLPLAWEAQRSALGLTN